MMSYRKLFKTLLPTLLLFSAGLAQAQEFYISAALGVSDPESGRPVVIDDDDTVLAYQASAGVLFELSDSLGFLAGINYIQGEEATVDSSLLPAEFDIEVDSFNYRAGLKWNF